MKWRDLPTAYTDRLAGLAAMDPWVLLGVARGASATEVRRAYLEKVRAYHPDRADPFLKAHSGRVLTLVNAAYERIRAKVDRAP